jgi:hypothetical protein
MVRVQATRLGPGFRRGKLRSTTTDSLTVAPLDATSFSVGLNEIQKLQLLRESHTARAKYTAIGLLVGAAGGAILGAATYSESKCDSSVSFCVDIFDRSTSAAMGAVLLGAVGGLAGFIAGSSPQETWIAVSLPR